LRKWAKDEAAEWLKEHDFKTGNYEKMANYHSFRQEDPDKYDSFRQENEPFDFDEDDGVRVIYGIRVVDGERTSEIQSIRFYHGEADESENDGRMARGRELRAVTSTARASGTEENRTVTGLGVIYDEWVELWPGYRERIKRGAVDLAPVVKSYFNHDPSKVLSTTESTPALKVNDVERGMQYVSPIPPTSYGNDLAVNLERGNVKGSSFAFDVPRGGDRWWEDDDGVVHREIKQLTLYEIGPVTDPAYITTTADLRSAEAVVEEWRRQQENKPPLARIHRSYRQRLNEIS